MRNSRDAYAAMVLEEATGIVLRMVDAARRDRVSQPYAFVARALGVTPRRIEQFCQRQVPAGAVRAHELEAFRAAQRAAITKEMRQSEHRHAVLGAMGSASNGMGKGAARLLGLADGLADEDACHAPL